MKIISNDNEITLLKKRLSIKFYLKDLRTLKYFFGIEIIRSNVGLVINQIKYSMGLLKERQKIGYRPICTLETQY